VKTILTFLFCCSLVGCTTVSSMRGGPHEGGVTQIYKSTYDNAFESVVTACESIGLRVAEKDYENKYIIATAGGRTNGLFINYGEVVGIYLDEYDPQEISITVVNKRRYKPGVFYFEDWTAELHMAINTYIARASTGS
jgi:hypothetical protein